jgi:hypothetical protein
MVQQPTPLLSALIYLRAGQIFIGILGKVSPCDHSDLVFICGGITVENIPGYIPSELDNVLQGYVRVPMAAEFMIVTVSYSVNSC